MKISKYIYIMPMILAMLVFTSCNNDDTDPPVTPIATCDDGVMNGTETGVDCGGTCTPCTEGMDPEPEPDFSGTYSQADYMGRPGINTVLSGDDTIKDAHNLAIPSEMSVAFQADFEARLELYHDVYAGLLGFTAADVDYQPNILGDVLNGPDKDGFTDNPVSAELLTTILATDVLEVAPDLPTTYFNAGAGAPTFDGAVALTGRTPQDDVIDVSLILLFGGGDGARFSGQADGNGGNLPRLTSDGVSLSADISTSFPYLGAPE